MSDTYDIGNLIRLSVAFTLADGTPIDPTNVQLNVRPSQGATEIFTYAANQVQKDGIGLYHYDYEPDASGIYYYRYVGTGGAIAAADCQFQVTDSVTLEPFPSVLPPCCND